MLTKTIKGWTLRLDEETLGITQRSVDQLRAILCAAHENEITILQVPTDDITCGYLIADHTLKAATFSGDGFRTDGGGEGGAGMKTAQRLLELLGIGDWNIETARQLGYESETELLDKLGGVLEEHLKALEYAEAQDASTIFTPSKNKTPYIRR